MTDAVMRMNERVRWFSQAMERQLQANDHKRGWQNEDVLWLLGRAVRNLGDLAEEIERWDTRSSYDARHILVAAADVANRVMMIADIIDQGERDQNDCP